MKSTPWKAALLLAAAAASCAHRGEGDSQRRGSGNPVLNAASTPLRDIGVIRPDVPEVLRSMNYPYNQTNLAEGCSAVAYEIGRLDAILGEESYQPGQERNLTARISDAAGDYAIGEIAGAADIVPYRSWVRRLSGASKAESRAAAAYAMGEQRRTFLRGYGAALGCPGVVPAPPPPPAEDEHRRQERAAGASPAPTAHTR